MFRASIIDHYVQVAILDGVTMGSGAGISLPGMFRVVTDRTVRTCILCADYDTRLCFLINLKDAL